MFRDRNKIIVLFFLAVLTLVRGAHAAFMFTGPPRVEEAPMAIGGTGMLVPPFPDVVPSTNPNGLRYTDGQIKYTFGNDDNEKITIRFRLERPYEITGSQDSFKKAGGTVQGDVTVTPADDPPGQVATVTNVMLDFRAFYAETVGGVDTEIPNSSKRYMQEDPMVSSNNSETFSGTLTRVPGETANGRLTAGSTGVLVGAGMIMFNSPSPAQPGAMITFNFPNSFDVFDIPEPASSTILFTAIVTMTLTGRPRRHHFPNTRQDDVLLL